MDLDQFLDGNPADVKEPEVLPSGRYTFVLTSYRFGEYNTGTQYIGFNLRPESVVDQDDLPDDANMRDFRVVQHKIALTENTRRMVKDTLSRWGLDVESYDSFRDAFEDAVGLEVTADVKKGWGGKNKDRPFNEVERFVPADSD